MEWNDKIEMVKLGSKLPENKTEFHKLVLDKLTGFDGQGVEMFMNLIELIPDEMVKDKEFYIKVHEQFTTTKLGDELGFRCMLRFAMFEAIVENDFKLE